MNKIPKMKIGLTTDPLEHLFRVKETIDIRLNEPMWRDLRIGDIVEFTALFPNSV